MTAHEEEATGDAGQLAPVYADESVTVYKRDCLELLPMLKAESVAAVVTDPPYGLAFMGRDWDTPWKLSKTGFVGREDPCLPSSGGSRHVKCAGCGGWRRGARRCQCVEPQWGERQPVGNLSYQLWCQRWARQCWRLLKPGGHMIAFGGARTWHRLAAAIEDAGFEVRDNIAWLYGQGFPKSVDIGKAIDRAAGAERSVIWQHRPVRRMPTGANVIRTGTWTRDDGRWFEPTMSSPATALAKQWHGWGTGLKPAFEPIIVARKPLAATVRENVLRHGTGGLHIDAGRVAVGGDCAADPTGSNPRGRWPANIVLAHAYGCTARCLSSCPVAGLDGQSGRLRSGANPVRRRSDLSRDCYGRFAGDRHCQPYRGSDTGGASRFFPAFRWQAKAARRERPRIDGFGHPTVKPLDLMRWLVRLVTPPGGLVLDPFLGSGTTAEAARLEGFPCIGIEREASYLPLIRMRLERHSTNCHDQGTRPSDDRAPPN